jgi:hypothetical protein
MRTPKAVREYFFCFMRTAQRFQPLRRTTSSRLSTAYQGPAEGTAEGEDRATRAAMADQATLEVGQVMADLLLRLGWACRRAGAEKAQRAAGAVRLAHASLKSLDRGSAWWSSGSAGAWCGSTALPTMGQVCAPVCCCLPPWPCAQPRGCALVFPSPALWRGPHIPARGSCVACLLQCAQLSLRPDQPRSADAPPRARMMLPRPLHGTGPEWAPRS